MIADPLPPALAGLAPFAESALLHEAMGRRGALDHDFRPIYPGAKLIGRALTIRGSPGDNLMFHLALSQALPGDVLVATVDGFLEAGGFGEVCGVAAVARGVRGFVLDGSIRDSEALARLNFPVFSRGISIKGTTKCQRGELNCPIQLGGVRVNPGDIVVGDNDGVVIIPPDEIDAVIAKAQSIRLREAELMRRLREGELTVDLLGLRGALAKLGLTAPGEAGMNGAHRKPRKKTAR